MKYGQIFLAGAILILAGCATNKEPGLPSPAYEEATADTADYKCPSGYVLRCESRGTGRIRFSKIGNANLESCSCETNAVPAQSPLPGIY